MFTRQKCEKHETQQLVSRRRRKRRFFLDEIDEVFDIEQDVVERNDDIPCPLNDYDIKTSKKLERRENEVVIFKGLKDTPDYLKLYLKDMGSFSLLTREKEISLAKEIERAEMTIMKALLKTRIFLIEVVALGEKIERDPGITQEFFDCGEDIAEGKLEEKKKQIKERVVEIRELGFQLERIPSDKKYSIARGRILDKIGRLIKELNLIHAQKERIIKRLKEKLRLFNELEKTKEKLSLKLKQVEGKEAEEELKNRIKEIDVAIRTYKIEMGLNMEELRRVVRSITAGKKISDRAKKQFVEANLRLVVSHRKKIFKS